MFIHLYHSRLALVSIPCEVKQWAVGEDESFMSQW